MKTEILIKNIQDKIIEMKAVCRQGIISRRQYGLAALNAKQSLQSNNYERMRKNLHYLCVQCGANTDIDWELNFNNN